MRDKSMRYYRTCLVMLLPRAWNVCTVCHVHLPGNGLQKWKTVYGCCHTLTRQQYVAISVPLGSRKFAIASAGEQQAATCACVRRFMKVDMLRHAYVVICNRQLTTDELSAFSDTVQKKTEKVT